jgi:hypothetical protein
MNDRMSRNGALLARIYAALVYVCGLMQIFGAAAVADTHAAGAFIFVLLPGVLFAMLSPFIWSSSRWVAGTLAAAGIASAVKAGAV